MNQLLSLALVVVIGICLIIYQLGFSAGKSEGHDEGRTKGKKEGAVRAFAVGYDRGKREKDEQEHAPADEARPRLFAFMLLVVATIIVLTLAGLIRQQG